MRGRRQNASYVCMGSYPHCILSNSVEMKNPWSQNLRAERAALGGCPLQQDPHGGTQQVVQRLSGIVVASLLLWKVSAGVS